MKSLFDQTCIGSIHLKNRLIRSATGDHLALEGHVTEEVLALYEDLAKGGVGTIITGFAKVLDFKKPFFEMLSIHDDSFIGEYKKLTDMVHSYGTNIILQVVYCGSLTMQDAGEGEIWGPSPVEHLYTKFKPKEMTKEDISCLQKAFADAALRAKKAGFDGIQLHAAHGFLLSQFLSPYYNRRSDEYGGSIENRARMLLETCSAVREMVGSEYSILIKINNTDAMEQGMTFEDCKYVCKQLAQAGIDAIEISGNWMEFPPKQEFYFKEHAAEIAAENDIPIILVGGNRDYHSITATLNETSIDYFSFSRAFIAEPDFVKRWESGDTSKAKCISCNTCANLDGVGTCILNRAKS
jgi:2,4-dienoyl-CoA reductase-like NADH-dependent reductase (Old Yellow Enzyme family)